MADRQWRRALTRPTKRPTQVEAPRQVVFDDDTRPDAPTGTGFRHVTSGSEDAAAKLVDAGDFNVSNVDGETNVASLRTLGDGAQQACAGDDPRLPPVGAVNTILYSNGTTWVALAPPEAKSRLTHDGLSDPPYWDPI